MEESIDESLFTSGSGRTSPKKTKNPAPPPISIAVPAPQPPTEGDGKTSENATLTPVTASVPPKSPRKSVKATKTKKKNPMPLPSEKPLPPTDAVPLKDKDHQQPVATSTKPFDEHEDDDDVPSDVSGGVDEPNVVEMPATPTSNNCSQWKVTSSSPRVPSDEAEEATALVASPIKQIKGRNKPVSDTTTPVTKLAAISDTTPETQASPSSPEFMQAYSHASPHDDQDKTVDRSTNKRLFQGSSNNAPHDEDMTSFLEEGNFQTLIAKSDDYDGDDESIVEGNKGVLSPNASRNHRRCFVGCFVFSLLMILAATGVAIYMFVFQNGDGIRSKKAQANVPPTLSPTMAPTQEPTAPTVSPVPSQTPTSSAVPSDLPSTLPSLSPSEVPSAMPSVSPSDYPSTVPTDSPTRDFTSTLKDYLFGSYGVVFEDGSSTAATSRAVEWLNQEAQQSIGGGSMEMTYEVAQRFALLTLEFSLLNLEVPEETQEDPPVILATGDGNVTDTSTNSSESVTFFGGLRQVPLPIAIWNSQFFVHQCNWTGIKCDDDNHVTQVRWDYREYTGTIPSEIRILTKVKNLDLSNNYLEGPIPEELFTLTNLEKLYLFKNFLTGTLSTRIGDLDKITHFQLSHNEFTGSIPVELKSDSGSETGIRPLIYFNVYSNKLTGTIPENLRLRQVKYFDVGRNALTGRLPRDLGETFVELRDLHLDHNDFRGTLPRSYNNVGNGRLESFTVNHNRLTGYVTGDRRLYNKLVTYTLHKNRFSGLDQDNCRLEIPYGEMVEFRADCDICRCNGYFDLCDIHC